MKVYAVEAHDGESSIYYATKSAAIKEARRAAREYAPVGENVDVEEITLVPMTKDAIVRLLNIAGGFVDESRVVASFPSRKRDAS